jgi:beta-lactamase regulating signal transducer with metallopeptidase domain
MTVSALDQTAGFVTWLLQSSFEACVLIGLVLVAQALLRDRLSAGWKHALWLLLLTHLLIPWSPSSEWSVYNLIPLNWSHAFYWTSPAPLQESEDALVDDVSTVFVESSPGTTFDGSGATSMEGSGRRRLPVPIMAGCIWIMGAVALGALILRRSVALALAVRRQAFVAGAEIDDLIEQCKRRIGCRREVRVLETPAVSSPALFAIVHPIVLLPTGTIRTMDRERLRHVFLHELAHLKRHDLVINWLATVLQVVHWFNPLVWYAFCRMRTDRELACDALVLTRIGAEESEEYGRTLVYLFERCCRRRSVVFATGFSGSKSQIRRRIEMITSFDRRAGSSPAIALVVMIALACVTLTRAQDGVNVGKKGSAEKAELIVPGERVGQFTFGATKAELIDKLGEPEGAFYGEHTFALDNLPKKYYLGFGELSFFVNAGRVEEITVLCPRWKLASGLTVGATEEEVKEVLGRDFHFREFPEKDFLVYVKGGLSFEIDKKKRTVMEINVQSKPLRQRTQALLDDRGGVIVPGERVGQFTFGAAKAELIDKLGEPERAFYGEHAFALDNLPPKYFLCFNELSFFINKDRVQGITVLSPRWKLPSGLRVGASDEEVKKALGSDFQWKEFPAKDFLVYEKAGLSFEIDKAKRTVMEINLEQKPQP